MAARCAPLAMRCTSTPARCRAAPTYAPMAPAPRTATFMLRSALASYVHSVYSMENCRSREPPMPVKPHRHPHPHGGAGGRPSCHGVAWEEARRIAVAAARALTAGNAPPPHSPDVPIGGAPVRGPAAGGRSVPGAPVVVPLVEALG